MFEHAPTVGYSSCSWNQEVVYTIIMLHPHSQLCLLHDLVILCQTRRKDVVLDASRSLVDRCNLKTSDRRRNRRSRAASSIL